MSKETNAAKVKSKEKKTQKKKKSTAFDILFRAVTAILAIAVFPVTYFMNLIYYALDWTNALKLIDNFKNVLGAENLVEGLKNLFMPSSDPTQQATEITYDFISLSRLDEFTTLLNTASSGESVSIKDMLLNNAGLRPLVISLALFALVLVIALVILIVVIFKNKPKIVAALSGVGTLLGIASYIVFVTRFANPLMDGTVTLGGIIGSDSLILQMLGDVYELRYDNAFFTVLFIMIGILIWSVSVIIVNSDDKTEKALRAAKKAKKAAKKAERDAKAAEKKAEKAVKALEEEKKKEEENAKEDDSTN